MAKNVFGDDLLVCSADPFTGFFRTGKCETCGDDHGMHTVCAVMTAEFLRFSKKAGNDLSTPHPEYRFPACSPVIAGVCVCPAGSKHLKPVSHRNLLESNAYFCHRTYLNGSAAEVCRRC